ncbi:MAG: nitroreductase family protein [Planctomycetota bacterium]|nr:nitroreductase family protein [Planctomycetota bacterium]
MGKVVDILKARYASRSMKTDEIPEDVIKDMIEAIRLTPSCYNKQPWKYIFCTSSEGLEKGRECLVKPNRTWADRAPLLVFAYSKAEDDCNLKDGRAYGNQSDVGTAWQWAFMLAATEHDLVARPMAGFMPDKVKETFEIPDEYKVIVAMAIGYYDPQEEHLPETLRGANAKPRERKDPDEFIRKV